MHENLRNRFNEIFQYVPKTKAAMELKDELWGNLIEKYNDLINEGKSEEDAIEIAIDGIGDVDELFRGLEEKDVNGYLNIEKERRKHAIVLTTAIGIYIMSVVVLILFTEVFNINEEVAVCIMILMCGVATCMLVYDNSSRPKYLREEDTVVEEFKEWKYCNEKEKQILSSIKSILWMVIVVVYIFISFHFGSWAYSWVIFIIGAAIEKIIVLSFQLKKQ
ncbi:permease prefix domain 1-containing protein [Haloimpatiens massiliensis]|uniref:permease prefix domain 1-containing protein n=1 Tax=Haloimpatiens massiliensis TaxID=1658110 RepID=UPI000C856D74|nr:permease prefix domain 1-containing protein [Haloimpatiens massiliensis]